MKYKFDQIVVNSTSKKKPVETDKEHYIGLEHLDSNCFTVSRWGADAAPAGEKLIMKKGDILFGKRRAYQRKVAIAPFDGIFSAHGMVLRPKTDVIDPDYFPFFLSSDYFMETAIRISVGGLSPTINWKDLKEQEFNLPSLEEQKVLANKLWAAYRLKEAYQRLLNATDEMVKSQFLEMFGTIESPKCEVKALHEVCTGSGQYGANVSADIYDIGKPRYIRITDINDEGGLNSDAVSAETYDTKYYLNKGDLLFARTGATVGKTYLHKEGDAMFAGYLIRYIPNTNYIHPEYLLAYTHSQGYWNWVNKTKKVGAQPNISATQYDEMPLLVPATELQAQFETIYRQADKSKFELRKAISAIDQVIKSLING